MCTDTCIYVCVFGVFSWGLRAASDSVEDGDLRGLCAAERAGREAPVPAEGGGATLPRDPQGWRGGAGLPPFFVEAGEVLVRLLCVGVCVCGFLPGGG